VGVSPAFRALRGQLEKVAKSNGRVMLSGPSGSGKEVCARFIHAHSARAAGPFVTVASAAIEPERMEEVLFGRAQPGRAVERGLLDEADGGTVYLDEVADMPAGTQSKILRVLVEQQFTRPGGTDRVRVDLRVISSTSHDLRARIAEGRFRQELFDRLSVVPIGVPGLGQRPEDIPVLAEHFIAEAHRAQGLVPRPLSPEAAAVLQTMEWPGNLRQLRNLIERVLILGEGTGPILPAELEGQGEGDAEGGLRLQIGAAIAALPLREAREVFERDYLLAQIARFGGNISRTAQFVGMERSALHRKLKSLGVANARAEDQAEGEAP
jgi:two-component system nitrogen regulation response regulator NtrX